MKQEPILFKKTFFQADFLRFLTCVLMIFGLTLCCLTVGAQITVTGTVTDVSSGEALIGATVVADNIILGTATEIDGSYSIQVNEETQSLTITYIGYGSQTIELAGRRTIDLAMTEGEFIDEIVVVGYGEQSKMKLTSAISTVDEKILKRQPVPIVSNALEGMASGLFVRQGTGEPGFSGSSFEVRNFGNALVIVDGAPGNLDELDANEIENISVLKDAAATAIYGVQGGNGVILVTTRNGHIGKPEFNYTNQFTFSQFTAYPEVLNSEQYSTIFNEGLKNAGRDPFYSEEQVEAYRSGSDPVNSPDVNWKNLMFRDYGLQQRHNLNVTGGNEKIRYFVSAGYLDQGSNYTSDVLSYQQFNIRSNIDASIKENLTLKLNLAGRRRYNEAPAYAASDIFRELSRALPNSLAYYPDGTPARPTFSPNHIVEGLKDFNAGYFRQRNNNIDAKLTLQWDVTQVEGLSLKSYASMVYNTNYKKEWDKSYELFTLNRVTGNYTPFTASPEGATSETVLRHDLGFDNQYVLQESINFDKSFGYHSISALALGELQTTEGQNFYGSRQDFQSNLIDQLFAGSNENKDANGGEFRENRLGLIGRMAYDYKVKYFVETAFRYDGSSKFAPGKQWGFFPSLSVGWRISEEPFFANMKTTIPELKLRASIGQAGNDGTAAFQWLSGFRYNWFFAINETAIPTITDTGLPNPDLTWETITTRDIGIDFALLDRDLTISADVFHRDKEGVLAQPSGSVPSTLGVGVADQNLHHYSNAGFEFSIDYKREVSRDLDYNLGFKYSRARETAVFIDEALIEDEFMRMNLTQTGNFTGLRRGYISDGLFQSQEEIESAAIQDQGNNSSIQPGDVRYVDLNGDNIIDVRDQKVYGNGDKAAVNYSINAGVNWKRFEVSLLLTGAAGYDIYLDGEAQSPLRNGFNGYDYQTDYWTPENTDARYPRITDGGFNDNNYRQSDFWSRDGTHLRMKNIYLRYALPSGIMDRLGIQSTKLIFSGHNLFVLKGYSEGFDPQMGSGTGWYYPQTKSYTVGLNITF